MKRFVKIISLLMAMILLSSLVACNDSSDVVDVSEPAPIERLDYSNSGKKFNFFGYSSLFDGSIQYDADTTYEVGESFVNKERIKEYFDSGMGFMLPQTTALPGADFVGSKAENIMNIAAELGHEKSVVLTDNWLYNPYNQAKSSFADEEDWTKITCIGTDYDWQFASEAELDAYVKARLEKYYKHPAFQGVFLPDEPRAKFLNVIGEVYKSLRRVQKELGIEEMYINANLLPYYPSLVDEAYPKVETSFHKDKEQRQHEAYRRYLERFMQASGAEYLQADIYPMSNGTGRVYRNYVLNMQLMAEVAKKYDAKILVVTQTTAYGGTKIVTEEDLRYLLNMTVGFGAYNVGYFTYYTHEFDGTNVFNDNGSMMNMFGDKTAIYYNVQKLNAEFQKLAPTILNFDYQTSKIYYSNNNNTLNEHMDIADFYVGKKDFADFVKLKDFSLNKECCIVNELYDKERDNYMYAVINSVSTEFSGSTVYETATLTFGEEYNKAYVYYNGKYKVYDLDENNSISVKTRPGEAQYVMPFAG